MECVIRAVGIDPGFARTGVSALCKTREGTIASWGVQLIETKKDATKTAHRLKATMDDERRMHEVWRVIDQVVAHVQPHVIGVEAYHVFDPEDHSHLRTVAGQFLGYLGLSQPGAQVSPALVNQLFALLQQPNAAQEFTAHLSALKHATDRFAAARGRGNAAKTQLVYGQVLSTAYRHGLRPMVFTASDLKRRVAKKAAASKGDVAAALCARIPGLDAVVEHAIKAKTKQEHVYDATGHALLALEEYESLVTQFQAPA